MKERLGKSKDWKMKGGNSLGASVGANFGLSIGL